jgi:hypothetical protein
MLDLYETWYTHAHSSYYKPSSTSSQLGLKKTCTDSLLLTKTTHYHNRTTIWYFFVSARYLKNEMSDLNETWYTHAWWWKEVATITKNELQNKYKYSRMRFYLWYNILLHKILWYLFYFYRVKRVEIKTEENIYSLNYYTMSPKYTYKITTS